MRSAFIYMPALLTGVWIGSRSFKSTNPEKFRNAVLALLAVLAVIIALKAVFGL
jgi:uncharacterized membrane protein YfcA